MSAAIVLQARLASQRLPGKALARARGRTILEWCVRRLLASGAAPVVLATTDRAEDDVLARCGDELGITVVRGDSTDVLGRFLQCIRELNLTRVVRATADNPAVDIDAPARVLAALDDAGADYVHEEGLPYGAAVEGVTAAALTRAAALAADPGDREHVTTFVRRRTDRFRVVRVLAPAALSRPDVRVTVDTPEDLERMRALLERVADDLPPLGRIIEAWDQLHREQGSGARSLRADASGISGTPVPLTLQGTSGETGERATESVP